MKQKQKSFQYHMKNRLKGSRFRWLNEKLYGQCSHDSFQYFNENSEAFKEYHEGFNNQIKNWPVNPLDIIAKKLKIRMLKSRDKIPQKKLIIADMGCGEAKLSRELNGQCRIYSFDLISLNENVIVSDIASVPLMNEQVDVVVFCLSLMGTNYMDFIKEGYRILSKGGSMLIAEVTSRFQMVESFIRDLNEIGLNLIKIDNSNSHFILFEFKKESSKVVHALPIGANQNIKGPAESEMKKTSEKIDDHKKEKVKANIPSRNMNMNVEVKKKFVLKPCIYKKR